MEKVEIVLNELEKLGKAPAEKIADNINLDVNEVVDTLWNLKNQGVVTVKNGIWHITDNAHPGDEKHEVQEDEKPVQTIQHDIIGDLLRKSRKEASRAGRKQKRWQSAYKALRELKKYRDLIKEIAD